MSARRARRSGRPKGPPPRQPRPPTTRPPPDAGRTAPPRTSKKRPRIAYAPRNRRGGERGDAVECLVVRRLEQTAAGCFVPSRGTSPLLRRALVRVRSLALYGGSQLIPPTTNGASAAQLATSMQTPKRRAAPWSPAATDMTAHEFACEPHGQSQCEMFPSKVLSMQMPNGWLDERPTQ